MGLPSYKRSMNQPANPSPDDSDESRLQNAAGVSLWRQVSEGLANDIRSGRFGIDQRLPSSTELAKRFQVNRHTVLKAIAHLQTEGLLRMERGRGTYAVVNPVAFGMGSQQWFELNLRERNRIASRTILSMEEKPASAEVARGLEMVPEAPVLLVTTLGEADGVPVNYGHHHLPLERLPGIRAAFEAAANSGSPSFSFADILKSIGVTNWRRRTIRIRGRVANRDELLRLKIAPNDAVLVTSVVSVNDRGVPIIYARTAYGGSRTELVIDL